MEPDIRVTQGTISLGGMDDTVPSRPASDSRLNDSRFILRPSIILTSTPVAQDPTWKPR